MFGGISHHGFDPSSAPYSNTFNSLPCCLIMEHARPKRRRVWSRLWTGIKNVMESLYFSSTLKLVSLRLLLIASLGNLCALAIQYPNVKSNNEQEDFVFSAVVLGFVVLHHALR